MSHCKDGTRLGYKLGGGDIYINIRNLFCIIFRKFHQAGKLQFENDQFWTIYIEFIISI